MSGGVVPPAFRQSAFLDRNSRTGRDINTPGVTKEQQADDQRHHRDYDRIPQAGVDIAGAATTAVASSGNIPPNQPLPM